jgi:AraC family transcriptional regulator of adaptative response/methylated-DNA-[protein]-cysteine methyltransferase
LRIEYGMADATLKERLRNFLEAGRLEEIADLVKVRKRGLGSLIALTFDADPLVVWRAIEAMGMSAESLAPSHPDYVKEHMRRLYWLITEESGAVFWRAPECMAECCARLPDLLKSHIPITFHLLETLEEEDLEHFRPGALWAIARLVELARQDLPALLPLVEDALGCSDPQARGMAVWCLGRVGEVETLARREDLRADTGPVRLYRNRRLEDTTVGRLTGEILEETAQRV